MSLTEWGPIKSLFWDTNDSIPNLTISLTSGFSLWDRPCYQNMSIYDNDNRCWNLTTKYFFLITEQLLAFVSHPNMVSKVKKISPNFKQIAVFYVIECFHLDS